MPAKIQGNIIKVVAFSGKSGSGKTTLILKIASRLINSGYKVAVAKHDPGDKACFDREGKDSYAFSCVGASVAVLSPKRTTLFLNDGLFGGGERISSEAHANKSEKFAPNDENLEADLQKLIGHFAGQDYLLVEGLKYIPLPRITVLRDDIDESYFKFSDAYATNLREIKGEQKPKFGLDDVDDILKWIDENAKIV